MRKEERETRTDAGGICKGTRDKGRTGTKQDEDGDARRVRVAHVLLTQHRRQSRTDTLSVPVSNCATASSPNIDRDGDEDAERTTPRSMELEAHSETKSMYVELGERTGFG